MPLVLTSTFHLPLDIDGALVNLSLKRLEPDEVTWMKAQVAKKEADKGKPFDGSEASYAEDNAFVTRCLTDFVTVDAGQLTFDGAEVRSGAQFLRIFAARTDLLAEVIQKILVENACSAKDKQQIAEARHAASSPAPLKAVAGKRGR
jgi:hypothetical protein